MANGIQHVARIQKTGGGEDVAKHLMLRGLAWHALGDTEKAKEDRDKAYRIDTTQE